MKSKSRKLISIVLAVVVAFTFLIIPETPKAYADGSVLAFKKHIKTTTADHNFCEGNFILFLGSKVKEDDRVSVKIDDESVVKMAMRDEDMLFLRLMKPGKCKITVNNNTRNKSYTCQLTVRDKCPFESFEIGPKDFAKKFKLGGVGFIEDYELQGKQKVKIVPRKGWDLTKIEVKIDKDETSEGYTKVIKNNSKVDFDKIKKNENDGLRSMIVTMHDKKSKKDRTYELYLSL